MGRESELSNEQEGIVLRHLDFERKFVNSIYLGVYNAY